MSYGSINSNIDRAREDDVEVIFIGHDRQITNDCFMDTITYIILYVCVSVTFTLAGYYISKIHWK